MDRREQNVDEESASVCSLVMKLTNFSWISAVPDKETATVGESGLACAG